MSPRGMAVCNTKYVSSSGKCVNAGIKGWKLHLSESTWCQESVGGTCFTNKWSAASLQPLIFLNHYKNSLFSHATLGLTVHFLGWTSGFSERGSQDLSNGANVVSQLANFFFVCTSIVYEKMYMVVTPSGLSAAECTGIHPVWAWCML